MNLYFLIAGILCFILGLVHSFLGEYLIFKDKRHSGSVVPSLDSEGLKERHLRIIWATWHLASLFGFCIGLILIKASIVNSGLRSEFIEYVMSMIRYTMLVSSLLVFVGTKGKHPGWIVLLMIAVLVSLGIN